MTEDNPREIVLGVDLGGSHISVAWMDISNSQPIYKKLTSPLKEDDKSFERVMMMVAIIIKQLITDTVVFKASVKGIGFALPGNADPVNGISRYLPNFPEWALNLPLTTSLQKAIQDTGIDIIKEDIPIHIRNDGRCAAIAESRFGVGKGVSVLSMLTLGTGIGGAMISNGELFNGASFDAGDFGHHSIFTHNPFICNCGKTACFEFQASALGLVRHYQNVMRSKNIDQSQSVTNALEVLSEYRKGDQLAVNAFNNYLEDLSSGLANIVTFYNPSVIALGGGLANASEFYVASTTSPDRSVLEAMVDSKTLVMTRGVVKIKQAVLGDDAGVIGACLLAM